jgi:hypothetical protein
MRSRVCCIDVLGNVEIISLLRLARSLREVS